MPKNPAAIKEILIALDVYLPVVTSKNGIQFLKYAVVQMIKLVDAPAINNGIKILNCAAPKLIRLASHALVPRNGMLIKKYAVMLQIPHANLALLPLSGTTY